jgi:hypothetical protein
MAKQIKIEIKEEAKELQYLLKQQQTISRKLKIKLLILLKQQAEDFKYPYQLSEKLKYTRKTIAGWIKLYNEGGINRLLLGNYVRVKEEQRTITKEISNSISELLENTHTTITSYVELQKWIEDNHHKVQYSALYYHCRKHFKSRLKVSRKSHHKKDEEAVSFFKNTTNRN